MTPTDLRAPRSTPMIIAAMITTLLIVVAGCGRIPLAPGQEQSGGPGHAANRSASPTSAVSAADCVYTATGTASRPVKLPPTRRVPMTGTATAVITLSAGKITVTLDRDRAPCTVNSFISLARQGFFDQTPCPRMTDAGSLFMLQCGDPAGDQTGGPGYTFPDELSGDETYGAGTVAMANSGPNSNGSQFFLVYKDSQLDPSYTVFGSFDATGIAVLTKIAAKGVDNSNEPHDGKPNAGAEIASVEVS